MIEACLPSLFPQPKPFFPSTCPQSLNLDKKADCKAHKKSSQRDCSGVGSPVLSALLTCGPQSLDLSPDGPGVMALGPMSCLHSADSEGGDEKAGACNSSHSVFSREAAAPITLIVYFRTWFKLATTCPNQSGKPWSSAVAMAFESSGEL